MSRVSLIGVLIIPPLIFQAFHAVLCWLTLSQTSGEAVKTVNSSVVKDNVSADSAPRLYRNVPLGVYASAAPYAAYSFHLPAFVAAPKAVTSASRIVPVINNANGYLRDSYGNRFVDTPQSAAYKMAFPQQFLPLQELPAHLAQPLVAASSQAKHPAQHYFLGSQYRGPTFQVAQHPSAHSFAGFSQPIVYGRSYASSPAVSHTQAITAQQQPSSNKAVYANTQSVHPFSNQKNEVKFQRLEHRPANNNNEAHHSGSGQAQENKAQIQAAPATIKAVVNGKETVVHIDTDPPVPLLDLSLLEPLTFENPLVPQVQHFLPRINDATYHKLPQFNINEAKKNSGNVKGKSPPKKKSKQPTLELDEHPRPVNPTITLKTTQNESPEIVYEINKPNYKETYKEKSVSYNKASDSDPITYSYDEKTQSEPIVYSYSKTEQKKPVNYNIVHETNEPVKIQHSSYGSDEQPKQLIYSFKPEEQSRAQNDHQAESEDSGSAEDSSDESDNERHHPQSSHPDHAQHYSSQGHPPSHSRQQSYSSSPNHHPQSHHPQSHHPQSHHQQSHHPQSHPQSHHSHSSTEEHHNEPRQNYNHRPKDEYHQSHHPHAHHNREHDDRSGEEVEHRSNEHHHRHNENSHHGSNEDVPHRSHENAHHDSGEQGHHRNNYAPQHQRSQDIKVPVQPVETQEFEEEIRIVPSEAPAGEIKDNPEKEEKEEQSFEFHPLSSLDQYQKFVEQQKRLQGSTVAPQPHNPPPVIHEQAKRIIIQEESPDEMHTHQEQNIMAEMIQDDGNDEEDFEKAYKNAAFGFNAFEGRSEKQEKDIYNPASYGLPREYTDFDIEKTPFEQYQASGDKFPKSARANYKDSRDHTKENYYLDYAVHKPESMADLYQNKANYYKLYKKQSPQKYFADEDRKKERKSEKYSIAPSYDFGPAPKKKQNYFAQYKTEPVKYEYKFGKDSTRDSTAHASRPYQRYKSKTYFVEPQFQYGFEPIAVPRLLDSELAAMASNHSPESEKPGMRKKIYKENWYIKKTSTSGGKPS